MAYTPAGVGTTTAGINHFATVWYNRRALDQLKRRFRFYNAAEPDMVPRRSGKTVQWFRYTLLGSNTAAPEGAVGNSNVLSSTTISGTVQEYADFITISTLADETAINTMVAVKSSLIDSNAAMPTRRKPFFGHRERLSEKTPQGDATVRSLGN
jgi:N4-gp56 family major capsid protein